MATVNYLLQSKGESAPIYLRLTIGGKTSIKRKTTLFCDFEDWNADLGKYGMPKQSLSQNKANRKKLRKLKVKTLNASEKMQEKGLEVSGDWLAHRIELFFGRADKSKKSPLLLDAVQRIIDNADAIETPHGIGLSQNRLKAYKLLKNRLFEFQESQGKNGELIQFKVKDFDPDFKDQLITYLIKERNYSKNYAAKIAADTKTSCLHAKRKGIKVSKRLSDVTVKKVGGILPVYLTLEELEQIRKAHIITPHLQNARKWLLFGCMIGQRGGDLLNITDTNFVTVGKDTFIELIQQKTNKSVTIPVLKEIKKILKDGLPHKISLQRLNDYIKEVCIIAGIDTIVQGSKRNPKTNRVEVGNYPKHELIVTHSLRRTYASNNYGVLPTPLIMSVTKHATEKMFLTYIGKADRDKAVEIIRRTEGQGKKNKVRKKTKMKVIKDVSHG